MVNMEERRLEICSFIEYAVGSKFDMAVLKCWNNTAE